MMTESITGKNINEALSMGDEFSKMMLGEDYDISEEMGDIEALSGVSQFPARIKCATLSWKALEKGVKADSKQ
jgi:nitrogen fixation NifU-like protein